MQEQHLFEVFDLSSFPQHHFPGKPYWEIDTQNHQHRAHLSRLLNADIIFQKELKRIHKDFRKTYRGKYPHKAIISFTRTAAVGITPENQYILIAIGGLTLNNSIRGGWRVFVCQPDCADQFFSDRNEEARILGGTIGTVLREIEEEKRSS
jgi:hypothetical protein